MKIKQNFIQYSINAGYVSAPFVHFKGTDENNYDLTTEISPKFLYIFPRIHFGESLEKIQPGDLECIIECVSVDTYSKQETKSFICFFLTPSTSPLPQSTTMNDVLMELNVDKINVSPDEMNVQNLKNETPINMSILSDMETSGLKCVYYIDEYNNQVIVLNEPVVVDNNERYQIIQKYLHMKNINN